MTENDALQNRLLMVMVIRALQVGLFAPVKVIEMQIKTGIRTPRHGHDREYPVAEGATLIFLRFLPSEMLE